MANVLVVEDDPEYREYLRTVLQGAGHRVTEAADGLEALDLLTRSQFDIVVTDILMPNLNGKELIEEIHARADGYLPIVAISGGGSGSPGTVLRAVAHLGVTASLEKPVAPPVLARTVQDALDWV